MALRFSDDARTLSCAVRDLVEQARPSPHLTVDLARSRRATMAEGRRLHAEHQRARAADDPEFSAESVVRLTLIVDGWTVEVAGRVDGLSREGDRPVVEEVKAVALERARLWTTTAADWPEHTAQLAIYLWMLAEQGEEPAGRLVLVSVLDGSRHVVGVRASNAEVRERVVATLRRWVAEREDRIAWTRARRGSAVPEPFTTPRPGQRELADEVERTLRAGQVLLAQAPTGFGKTAPVLVGALRAALATDRQVCWVTARTTQQRAAVDAARALAREGLALRVVVITARERACVQDTVDCRAEVCAFAADYHDKLAASGGAWALHRIGPADAAAVRERALDIEACPYQLAVDAARAADLVIADYNYVFDPDVAGAALFGEDPERWFVVVDEAHQLVERGRGYGSPRVARSLATAALAHLEETALAGIREIAQAILAQIDVEIGRGRSWRGDEGLGALDRDRWRALAGRVDAVAADYALLREGGPQARTADDPWLELAWATLRLADGADRAGIVPVDPEGPPERAPSTVTLVRRGADAGIGLCCLDPSALLGARIARLGGLVGCSATLSPPEFYRDLLGIPRERLARMELPWPFPPENCRVLLAPRVSTRFADRREHAPRTAALIGTVIAATPGNVAVYFPSFAMLDDLVARVQVTRRDLVTQRPSMSDAEREAALSALRQADGPPVVLAAVLGGVFAEGIDLPRGALSTVVVIGPGLPPVGLERDLLRACFEARYGQGFRYASLVPGLTRVVQAAGRLIRGPEDVGCVVLVGGRFRHREIASLLPASWAPDVPDDPASAVRAFFAGDAG